MNIQKNLLRDYMRYKGNPTLKHISEETGIQLTRVFRILNGSEMKISEYQVFNKLIRKEDEFKANGDEYFDGSTFSPFECEEVFNKLNRLKILSKLKRCM